MRQHSSPPGLQAALSDQPISQREALRILLDLIGGPAGRFVELRAKRPRGMKSTFAPTGDRAAIEQLARCIMALGSKRDVYVGVAPRDRQEGTAAAVTCSHALWADGDTPAAVAAIRAFSPLPAILIESGSVTDSTANLHAYWPLCEPLSAAQAVRANRRLAYALGADAASTDAARILRPPATLNFKTTPPRPVRCTRMEIVAYTAKEIVGNLADPPERGVVSELTMRRLRLGRVGSPYEDVLRGIPASVYVPALTGRPLGRDGKIRCPLHAGGQERTPSLHAYDGDRGWYCFGCQAGGSIIDFAAKLYGIEPKGKGFDKLRRRIAAELLKSWGQAA